MRALCRRQNTLAATQQFLAVANDGLSHEGTLRERQPETEELPCRPICEESKSISAQSIAPYHVASEPIGYPMPLKLIFGASLENEGRHRGRGASRPLAFPTFATLERIVRDP